MRPKTMNRRTRINGEKRARVAGWWLRGMKGGEKVRVDGCVDGEGGGGSSQMARNSTWFGEILGGTRTVASSVEVYS